MQRRTRVAEDFFDAPFFDSTRRLLKPQFVAHAFRALAFPLSRTIGKCPNKIEEDVQKAQAAIKSIFPDATIHKCSGNEEKGRLSYTAYGSNDQARLKSCKIERMGLEPNPKQKRILCMNKVDLIEKKTDFLEVAEQSKDLNGYEKVFMISGLKGSVVKDLNDYLIEKAVKRPWDEDPGVYRPWETFGAHNAYLSIGVEANEELRSIFKREVHLIFRLEYNDRHTGSVLSTMTGLDQMAATCAYLH